MISMLWAGHDTTAIIVTRILQLLGSPEGQEVRQPLIEELRSTTIIDSARHRAPRSHGPNKGILSAYPVLASIMLETFR